MMFVLIFQYFAVDFVLRDPREKEDEAPELPPHRAELEVVPKPWNKSYVAAGNLINENLNITNPTMMNVLDLWHASFG